jgi:hypothetical protein
VKAHCVKSFGRAKQLSEKSFIKSHLVERGLVSLVNTFAGDHKKNYDEWDGNSKSTTPQQEEGLVNGGCCGGSGRLSQLEGSSECLKPRTLLDTIKMAVSSEWAG